MPWTWSVSTVVRPVLIVETNAAWKWMFPRKGNLCSLSTRGIHPSSYSENRRFLGPVFSNTLRLQWPAEVSAISLYDRILIIYTSSILEPNSIVDPGCLVSLGSIHLVAVLHTTRDVHLSFTWVECNLFILGYKKKCNEAQITTEIMNPLLFDLSGIWVHF